MHVLIIFLNIFFVFFISQSIVYAGRGVGLGGVWALSFESDGDVRQRPRKRRSFGDRLNKEKRGLSVRTSQDYWYLVGTIKIKGSFIESLSFEKKGVL